MNWHERIEAAEKRGEFTSDDRKRAYEWVDCACGEQDKRIPRNKDGEPMDNTLSELGAFFADAVDCDDFDAAADYLQEIEHRAAQSLAEIGAQP
jgi:hypothetical protein